jgi:hypothetical protein
VTTEQQLQDIQHRLSWHTATEQDTTALLDEVRRLWQQQSATQATWIDEVTQARAERDEYCEENARLRKALSQYQQPGALVRYGVPHEPGPWLLTVMEDGYWTPWHIANADAVRLESERDAALAELDKLKANRDALLARIEAERVYVENAGRERDDARESIALLTHVNETNWAALTEARRVLRLVMRDYPCTSSSCHRCVETRAAVNAVLAQEEPS